VTSRFWDIEDAEHVWKFWQKNYFSAAEFPTLGRLKRGSPVGADAYGYHDSYPLKYATYELSDMPTDQSDKYPPLEIFRSQRGDPHFHGQLRELYVNFLQMIKKRVDDRCARKHLTYQTIVFTMPSQWGGKGNSIHDTFESIIREVWAVESFPEPILFIFEIEALAHALIHEAGQEFQQYDQVMLIDCGGHITVRIFPNSSGPNKIQSSKRLPWREAFSLFELRWSALSDPHAPPPFYQVGDSHSTTLTRPIMFLVPFSNPF
jgi:hypothetical protein